MKLRTILTVAPLALILALPVTAQTYGAAGGGHQWRSAGRHDRGMGRPGGQGLLGQQMIQFLQLTQDQITQAQTLIANLKQQAAPLRDQLKQNRQQFFQLMSSANPDPSAIGTLLLQQKSIRDQLRALRQSGADQFAKLLTSDQQARFATIRAWWQARPRPGQGGAAPQGSAN